LSGPSWAVFRIVGANPVMKSECFKYCYCPMLTVNFKAMYQFYEVLICLLKFDFFAFTGITIQVRCPRMLLLSILPRRLLVASHRCSLEEFSRVWFDNRRDSCSPSTPFWLQSCRPTRNQIVRILGPDVVSSSHTFAIRLMAFSLFLMLASETYCK
jgi:hypothetical protein